MINFEFFEILKWWSVFLLIGISFLPLTSKFFENFVDKGYIFSKIIGLLIITYSIFILSTIKLVKFNEINILIIWIFLFVIQLFIFRSGLRKIYKFNRLFLIEEIIFLAGIFFWAYIRSFNPDIHDLEKFMDFGFINSILRSEYFPPKDMWLTPFPINYYYFGHLFTALVTKLTQIPSLITFNLMLSTIFAFTLACAFSIGINLTSQIQKLNTLKLTIIGLSFGLFLAFAGNLQTIYAFFLKSSSELPTAPWNLVFSPSTFPNEYWYPNATRFIYNTIHEFPMYSFVVADLHGHVLNIPVALTTIALLLVVFINKKNKYSITFLFAFLISISYMTNAWDGLIYLALVIFAVISIEILKNINNLRKNSKSIIVNSIKQIFTLGFGFTIFTLVFNMNFDPFASGIGVNCSPQFLVNIKSLGPLLFEEGQCQRTPWWQFTILYGFFMYMFISFLIFLRNKKIEKSDIFVMFISAFSFLLLIAPEILYLKDIYTGHFRANTMFKLAYQAFIMLSISSVYIFFRILFNSTTNPYFLAKTKLFINKILNKFIKRKTINKISINPSKKHVLGSIATFIHFLLTFSLLYFVLIYPNFAINSGYGDLKERKNLNGINYLKIIRPDDYNSIVWINNNIYGQPVILEAQGDSYTDYARISANTGLPTVLGWTVHEWLWRGSYDVPSSRFEDISTLYESENISKTKELIEKYNIKYVYLGGLEREKYNLNEDKFKELGFIVYSNGDTKIYKIDY